MNSVFDPGWTERHWRAELARLRVEREQYAAAMIEQTERVMQAEAEMARLREQLRIASDALEAIAACSKKYGGERYPGACATTADDALTQMSVVE